MRLKTKIYQSTSNLQRRKSTRALQLSGYSKLNRACWKFLFLFSVFPAHSISAQTPPNELPPLAPPLPELPPTFWEQHEIAIIVLGLLAVMIVVIVAILALRPKPPVLIPPEIAARRALEELRSRSEDGEVLSKVSRTLRRYFIAAFALSPGEYTTTEFCRAISAEAKVGTDISNAVSIFLYECDERKFSNAGTETQQNAASRALELIASAEARRDQPQQSATNLSGKP